MKHLSKIGICLCIIGTTWTPIPKVQAHEKEAVKIQQALPSNFVTHADREAERLVPLWVKYINEKIMKRHQTCGFRKSENGEGRASLYKYSTKILSVSRYYNTRMSPRLGAAFRGI